MRKLLMSLAVLAGLSFVGTLPAAASPASGLTTIAAQKTEGAATQVRWHGGWGWGGPRFYFGGYGRPYYGYGYYPAYGYYDNYYYGYPRYYGWRRHHYWGHRHWRRW
jgi:hypothetical protein